MKIIRIVLAETKFANGFHTIESSEWVKLCKDQGLQTQVYCCITPSITISFDDHALPARMRRRKIDLRHFQEGVPTCQHEGITLHWEEGGGGLDSGQPFYYDMCRKCGYSNNSRRTLSWFSGLLSRARRPKVVSPEERFFKRV